MPTRTRYISLARARLRQHGYRVASGSAEAFPTRVRALALPGPLLSLVAPRPAVRRHLNRQLAYCDDTPERVTAHDARLQRLRTVPSVGPVTAAAFVATVDDVQRFRSAHPLEAYLALVPRECRSGDTQRRGPIPQAGPGRTRWLWIHVPGAILRRRPPEAEALRVWALRLIARRGTQVGSSRSPAAWRASSLRCSATALSSPPADPRRRWPPPRSQPAPPSEGSAIP